MLFLTATTGGEVEQDIYKALDLQNIEVQVQHKKKRGYDYFQDDTAPKFEVVPSVDDKLKEHMSSGKGAAIVLVNPEELEDFKEKFQKNKVLVNEDFWKVD